MEAGVNELALFAGAGGGILGGKLLGWKTVCAVEIEPYCRRVLMQRQNDGVLDPFPIWDDVCTFDGKPWRGIVDVVSGGFPCQDISIAGKGAGIDGERSGLWGEMARIIGEVRPRFAFVENSPVLTSRGLGRVLGDLAEMGFDAKWGCVSAADAIWAGGTPAVYHERTRIWILANSERLTCEQRSELAVLGGRSIKAEQAGLGSRGEDANSARIQQGREEQWPERERAWQGGEPQLSNADIAGLEIGQGEPGNDGKEQPPVVGASWWLTEPAVGRVADRVANRVDRLKAIGNGQVPICMAAAFQILSGGNVR